MRAVARRLPLGLWSRKVGEMARSLAVGSAAGDHERFHLSFAWTFHSTSQNPALPLPPSPYISLPNSSVSQQISFKCQKKRKRRKSSQHQLRHLQSSGLHVVNFSSALSLLRCIQIFHSRHRLGPEIYDYLLQSSMLPYNLVSVPMDIAHRKWMKCNTKEIPMPPQSF